MFINLTRFLSLFVFAVFSTCAYANLDVLLPDPFFRRFDMANVIVLGELSDVKPTTDRIKDSRFDKFSDAGFRVGKLKVEKVWKGNVKRGEILQVSFLIESKETKSIDEKRISVVSYYSEEKTKAVFYLREVEQKLVASIWFGVDPGMDDLPALNATVSGKPENEIIKLLYSFDKFFYERQIKEKGSIDRSAAR